VDRRGGERDGKGERTRISRWHVLPYSGRGRPGATDL